MVISNNAKRYRKVLVLIFFCIVTTVGFLYNIRTRSLKVEVAEPELLMGDVEPAVSTVAPCHPRNNVLFLKTHKCASSAVQNIFLRYGDAHSLVFALPVANNYLGHPAFFNRKMVPSLEGRNFTYNLFAHHSRFHYKEMRAVMPSDTVLVTVVRHPVDLFESMFSYYEFPRYLTKKTNKSLEELAKAPDFARYFPSKRILSKFGFNQMLFDLGFDPKLARKESAVREYINTLDSVFDLVLVAERMDESLILLRDLLCWNTKDVVTFKSNRRANRFKKTLSPAARERILWFNHADELLYNYFISRLDERIRDYGRAKMDVEVSGLRNVTDYWYERCIEKELPNINLTSKYYINKKVMSYRVKKNDTFCDNLAMPELAYTDKLMKKQAFFYPKKKPPKPRISKERSGRVRRRRPGGRS